MKRAGIIGLAGLGGLLVLVYVAALIFAKPYRIPSESMLPALEIGDRILVRKGGYDPERGDIVVLNPPAGADTIECEQSSMTTVAHEDW